MKNHANFSYQFWIDNNARLIFGICVAIILGLVVAIWIKFLPQGNISGPSVCTFVVLLVFIMQSHYYPLRISNGSMYLASPHFPSIGRKPIKLSEIKEIFIDKNRKMDEGAMYGLSDNVLFVARVTDKQGNQYRNMIFGASVKEFKKVLIENGYPGILQGH